ncbi:DMT family transporter [Rhodopseudomonas palustris]|uniref:EamA domain-containing protein n=1 Tax=Rhodopseudomonas palustris (strain BisB18) TaxID=316056 RepID=Q20Y51_RHOPB
MTGSPWLGLSLLLAVSLLWGTSFVLIEIAAQDYGALSIALSRAAVAAVVLGGVAVLSVRRLRIAARIWPRIVLLSVVGQVVPFFLLGLSGRLTSSSSSAVMMGAAPIATIVVAGLMLQERWSAGRWLGVVVAGAGVVIAFGWNGIFPSPAPAGFGSDDALGKLCALGAALGYAFGAIIFRSIPPQIPPMVVAALSLSCSSLLLAAGAVLQGDALIAFGRAGAASSTAMVALGVLNTGCAYAIYYKLISISGAGFASLNNYLVPIIGATAGAVLLGEAISWNLALGLLMIVCGILLSALLQN